MLKLRYIHRSPEESGSTPPPEQADNSVGEVPMGLSGLLDNFVPPAAPTTDKSEQPKTGAEPEGQTPPAAKAKTPAAALETPAGTAGAGTGTAGADDDNPGGDEGETTVFSLILQDSGLTEEELVEAGFEIPEEETVENVQAFVGKLTKHLLDTAPQRVFTQLEEKLPDVADFLEFRMNGGKASEYFALLSGGDISELDLSQEAIQRQVVTRYLTEISKFTPEEATEEVQALVDSSRLEGQATKFHKKLVEHHQSSIETLKTQQAAKAEQTKQQQTQLWNTIQKTVITDGKITTGQHEVAIPAADRNGFYRFIKEKGADGLTESQKFYSQMDVNTRLLFDWLAYKKVDLAALGARVKTTAAVGQKSRLLSTGTRMGGGSGNQSRAATGKTPHIPLTGEGFGAFLLGE